MACSLPIQQIAPASYAPPVLPFQATDLPSELRPWNQWVNWRVSAREGPGTRWTKIPVDPRTGRNASVKDPATWAAVDVAIASAPQPGGVGFVFCDADPFIGIDLDGCRDAVTGKIDPWAQEIIVDLDSYTEISASGTGVHVIVQDTVSLRGRRAKIGVHAVEVYQTGRFFVMTGQVLDGLGTVAPRSGAGVNLLTKIAAGSTERGLGQGTVPCRSLPPPLREDDEAILVRARNSEKFVTLFDRGDHTRYKSSSEVDLALCNLLVYAGATDHDQIDRLFRRSRLYRLKWERPDYRKSTITKALMSSGADSDAGGASADRFASPVPPKENIVAGAFTNTDRQCPDDDLWAEVARLRDQNAKLRAECDEAQKTISILVRTMTNPHIKAEAVTAVRLAAEIAHRQGKGEQSDAKGFWRVSPANLGGDHAPWDDAPVSTPIRGRGTVRRHLAALAERGLIERHLRKATALVANRDTATKRPVRDRVTGRPLKRPLTVDETWVRLRGSTFLEMLETFASYAPASGEVSKRHGGKRAKRDHPLCLRCGGTGVTCGECGGSVAATPAADRSGGASTRASLAPRGLTGDVAVQDEPPLVPVGVGVVQDEPRGCGAREKGTVDIDTDGPRQLCSVTAECWREPAQQ